MKCNRFFRATALFAAFSLFFAGCSNILKEEENPPANAAVVSYDATLTVGIEELSRTALPEVALDDLNSITLYYQDTDISDGLDGFKLLGSWESVSEMREAVISFKTGTFDFALLATSDVMAFYDERTVTIASGENTLSFTPRAEATAKEAFGKGNLSVSIRYDDEGVAAVTAGLYSLEGMRIAGYGDQTIAIEEGGNSTYTKNNVPSGNYMLIFKFYADADKKLLRASYREYCSIVNGKTSTSECVLDVMGGVFSITYELNGGTFNNQYTSPGSFTRQTAAITLPTASDIAKANCTFAGWYDNAKFDGLPVTEIPSGSVGDRTYYAKWLNDATIIFVKNDGAATIVTMSQVVQRGVAANLKTASELGLVTPTGKRFLGWSKRSTATTVDAIDYIDGDAIVVTANTTLYAVWSVSAIDPQSADDTSDADKDGLTDWEELYKYFTDPSNPDTDGDGWSDGYEVHGMYEESTNTFNPLIADVPALEVQFFGKPQFSYTYAVSSTKNETISITNNEGVTGSSSSTSSSTKSRNETHGWGVKLGVAEKWGSTMEISTSQEASYSGSVTNGDTYTYSASTSASWSKSWSNGRSTASSSGKTINGGKVTMQVKFRNPSNISYTVNTVTLAVNNLPVGSAEVSPVASVTRTDVGTIPAGTTTSAFIISFDLGIDGFEKVMKWSSGLSVEVSGYTISIQKQGFMSNDFTEALTKVKALTSALYIDWGNMSGRKPVTYNIAVKNQYNKNSTSINDLYTKTTLEYVLQKILHMDEGSSGGYVLSSEGYIKSIYGVENAATAKDGAWYLCHKYTSDGGLRKAKVYGPYESTDDKLHWKPSDITISAGDELSLIYSTDQDNDGVPLNEELIYGTDDTKADTDGDGLTDYEEIYGWYKSHLDSRYSDATRVYTNPINTDTDGDDLLDYSADSAKRDTDPVTPKMKDDASLGICQYKKSNTASFSDFTFNSSGAYTLSDCNEYIWLNIESKLIFGTVQYKVGEDGTYSDVDKTTAIKLNVGTNKIYVLCTAPDEITTKEYVLTVNSVFRTLSSFKLNAPAFGEGQVNFTWTSYADERASASDGGYILFAKKETTPEDADAMAKQQEEEEDDLALLEDLEEV